MRYAFISFWFCFLFLPSATFACTCTPITREEAAENADLIFLGKAEVVVPGEDETEAVFFLDNVFKGVSGPSITVRTPTAAAACGQKIESGQTYLIYSSKMGNSFYTWSCDGNKLNPGANLLASLGTPKLNYENRTETNCPVAKTAAINPDDSECRYFQSLCEVPDGWQLTDSCNARSGLFSDVSADHPNYDAILALSERSIVKGYSDGTFRPEKNISRAAFVKIVIEASFSQAEINSCPTDSLPFPDVPAGEWFAPYVCLAKQEGIISGYPDGTFRPEKNIGIAAAAKIIAELYKMVSSSASGEWYRPYIVGLTENEVIPDTITHTEELLTRGEVVEMIWRAQNGITGRAVASADSILSNSCEAATHEGIPKVDIERVRTAWLDFYNNQRRTAGLTPYIYNPHLHRTAYDWSSFSAKRGYMDHKRPGQTAYYDYNIIKNWFEARGLVFKNDNRVTFTENIGWGPWRCKQNDCTQKMIDSIRTTFDFYLAEEDDSYRPHYEAIFHPLFREIGLGIALSPAGDKYYLTVHFGTEIISDPAPVCAT